MTAQDLTRLREAILRALYPLTAVATMPATITRTVRRDGLPDATEADVKAQLSLLTSMGHVQSVAADGAGGELSAADKGWQLTAKGIRTAEELTFS